MTGIAVPAAMLLAAIAAWLSQGTLALATAGGPRLAVVPASVPAFLIVIAAALAVAGAARARLSLTPVALLVLLILPWLPLPASAAVLAWAGPARWLIWFTVALLIAAPAAPRALRIFSGTGAGRSAAQKPALAAGVLAFAIFAASAWSVAPLVPGGDEPHYLVITQSLLFDRDLKIENNHRRGDYQSYYAGALPPHYLQRGRDNEIYSIHAPGLPALVAPAFALGGYRGVVVFLLMMAACGSALAWHLGWLATKSVPAAWFGWAATTWSATAIFHSFTVYPDGLGGVVVLTGVWALFRAHEERIAGSTRVLPWFLHGAALALLPWMHSRFALLAGSLGALILLRLSTTKKPMEKAVAFLAAPALSAIGWMAFFAAVYGRPDPSAPYGASSRDFSAAFIPGGLAGLLFDERFGLLSNAPVLIFAFAGLVWMLWRRRDAAPDTPGVADWRLALELLFVLVPYLLTATSYAMWWAGWSAPARFANPAVFALAIPAAVFWQRATGSGHRATIVVAGGALALTAFLSLVLVSVDGGRLAYNTRETTALLLEWASPLAALGEGMPVWFRGRELEFTRDAAIWIVLLTAGYAGARSIAAWPGLRDPGRYATSVAALFAAAGMIALTVVWRAHGVDGIVPAPSQLALLRRLAAEPRVLAVGLEPPRLLDRERVLSMLYIATDIPAGVRPGAGRSDQPLVTLPSLPAGRYRVRPRLRGPGGWLMLGVAQDQFAFWSAPTPPSGTPIDIDLPVDIRALVVRGDEDARRSIASVVVEPVSLVAAASRLTDRTARRAVKYAGATVFFLDEGCFPEPEAFWIGGARQGTFVLQPSGPGASIAVLLRNAPVENTITLTSGQWRETLTLAPGEERRVEIPIAPGRGAALVTASSASGFRPSEQDPASRDQRFLGAWVKVGRPDR